MFLSSMLQLKRSHVRPELGKIYNQSVMGDIFSKNF